MKRTHYALYAVVLREHPSIVKIGQTTNWKRRRCQYDCWNFADGDGVSESAVFVVTEEYCCLRGLESECLAAMDAPLVRGVEWFRSDIEHAKDVIRSVLNENAMSFEEL